MRQLVANIASLQSQLKPFRFHLSVPEKCGRTKNWKINHSLICKLKRYISKNRTDSNFSGQKLVSQKTVELLKR